MRKFTFLLLLLLVSASFFYFRLYDYLSLSTIKIYKISAQEWTHLHYNSAVALYIIIFVAMIACAIPCATVLTLIGGFLFGLIATLYATFSITFGGMILFLAVRSAIGHRIAARSSGWIKTMERGFQQNAFSYLLTLRLVPIFPCWVSNIGAGILNVPLKTFVIATALGVLPATVIYVLAGRGLDKLLADTSIPLINLMLNPAVFLPLLGLALLSIFPVIYKVVKKLNQTS